MTKKNKYTRFDSSKEWTGYEETPEGYIRVWGVVATPGELSYKNTDGSTRTETVTAETLRESAPGLLHKPVTLEHPKVGLIWAGDVTEYQVGTVTRSEWVEEEQEHRFEAIIHDKAAVDDIKSKKRVGTSPGYVAGFDNDELVQIERHNNHLALTREGRGGSRSSIRLDSAGHVTTEEHNMAEEANKLQIRLDAADEKNALLRQELATAEAERDAYKVRLDAKDEAPDFIQLYKEHKRALEVAEAFGIEVAEDLDTEGVRRAVVESKLPESAVRQDSVYFDAAFDLLSVDAVAKKTENKIGSSWSKRMDSKQEVPAGDYDFINELVDPTSVLHGATKGGN